MPSYHIYRPGSVDKWPEEMIHAAEVIMKVLRACGHLHVGLLRAMGSLEGREGLFEGFSNHLCFSMKSPQALLPQEVYFGRITIPSSAHQSSYLAATFFLVFV